MSQAERPFVIVAATDYSETGELAFDRALELAIEHPTSEVHVLHVLPYNLPALAPEFDTGAAGAVTQPIAEAADWLTAHVEKKFAAFRSARPAEAVAGMRVVPHLRLDSPAIEIAQLATDIDADVVVVGTHGRRALSRLVLGSVAEVAVRLAPCPVLVVRAKAVPESGPTIEPPCPRCVETRAATGRKELWCEQHRERHGRRHTYHQGDRAGAETNMPLVIR